MDKKFTILNSVPRWFRVYLEIIVVILMMVYGLYECSELLIKR